MEHTKPTRSRKQRTQNFSFELPINGISYTVNATPFTVPSGETMYRLSYNEGPVLVFGWDEGLERFAEMEKVADTITPSIEMSISEKLEQAISEIEEEA